MSSLLRAMVGVSYQPPPNAALFLRVLMVVLRRQRFTFVACRFPMTAHATKDA